MKKTVQFFICFIYLTIPFLLSAQVSIEIDTYHPDDNSYQTVTYSEALLEAGEDYSVEVEGTFSPWGGSTWTNPCGMPDDLPMHNSDGAESIGLVGHDFAYNFGLPNNDACNGNPALPQSVNVLEVSVDGGESWFVPTVNESYNTEHIYTFELEGQGQPLMIKILDLNSSDNYGKLLFEISMINTSSFQEFEKMQNLETYPNPVAFNLELKYKDNGFSGDIFIYNAAGTLVKEIKAQNQTKIDMSDLASGVYIVKFIEAKTNHWDMRKVVKIKPRA